MSRIANQPITIPQGVSVDVQHQQVTVKGKLGTLVHELHPLVTLEQNDQSLKVVYADQDKQANAQAGTARALLNNMIGGVHEGFSKKLTLVGVGYRAKMTGKTLEMTLGFSHPITYTMPEGITIETPTQTEVIVKGCSKQQVGQVSAELRAFRPPEPYKGKGVRYADETIILKEARK